MKATSLKVLTPNIEEVKKIHDASPLESLVLRHYVGFDESQSHFIEDANGVVDFVSQFMSQFNPLIDYAESAGIPVWGEALNEVSTRFMWGDAQKYNDFTVRFAYMMKRHGVLPLGYSWYPGNLPGKGWVGDINSPNPEFATFEASLANHWSYFVDGVDACVAADGGIALHAYGGDSLVTQPWWEWYILRYRKDWAALGLLGRAVPPTFLTEFGIDRGFIGVKEPEERGWRKVPLTEREYGTQMLTVREEFNKDYQMRAAHVFLLGAQ
jgi:hypothetical protein